MPAILEPLIEFGTQHFSDKNEIRKIRISNQLCLFGAITGVITLLWGIFAGFDLRLNLIIGGLTLLLVLPIFLNAIGKIKTSRVAHVLGSYTVLTSIPIIFGPDTHYQNFLITVIGMPILFMKQSSKLSKWILILAVLPFYGYLLWHFEHFDPIIQIQDKYISILAPANDIMVFVTLIYIFYIFATENDRHVTKIQEQNVELAVLNKDLDEALERSKEATKSKSQFLANMSHEIRTPLNGIIGSCDLIQSSELTEEQRGIVDIISNSGDNLLNLINDILDFSKIEAGKLDIDSYDFNLHDAIESVMDQFKVTTTKKNIELICYIDERTPKYVRGDALRITQILINLIGNAVKFTEEGQVFLNVRSKTDDPEKKIQRVVFNIEDTGIGISHEKIEEIFESFTQEDGSTSRTYGGTGLGTTISKLLVELMNGEINAISPNPNNSFNNNPGSVFSFEIDLQLGEYEVKETHRIQDLSTINCLVVDDNETNLFVLQKLLSKWGVNVDLVRSGEECLKHLWYKVPDLIIMDYHMPGKDGLETVNELRKINLETQPKVILLSSDSSISKERVLKDHMIDECLFKPTKQSKLLNSILHVLNLEIRVQKHAGKTFERFTNGDEISILLAEDNIINQQVALMLFDRVGLTVDVAENGRVAVEKAKKTTYDLIFMDYHMPEMDGLEATAEIRELGLTTPIIAMTANAMKGDREHFISSGMNDYLSKPVKMEDLYRVLQLWLNQRA